jgi:hypothetical protein
MFQLTSSSTYPKTLRDSAEDNSALLMLITSTSAKAMELTRLNTKKTLMRSLKYPLFILYTSSVLYEEPLF